MKTHVCTIEYLLHFPFIVVSFLTYLIIFTPNKTLLISQVSHLGHHSLGGISRCSAWHLSLVFTCYLLLIIDFSYLYRDYMITKFAFFASKEDRWGNNMMALWGNLKIWPCLNYLELLYHISGELLSINCLKIWGDIQEPHNNMAYLLVHTGDASWAETYSMALVWISPHQVQASTMEEAVGT